MLFNRDEMLFMVDVSTLVGRGEALFLDSNVTYHITLDGEWFLTYDPSPQCKYAFLRDDGSNRDHPSIGL